MKQAIAYCNNYVGVVDKPMTRAIAFFASKRWDKAYQLFHTNNERSEANLLAAFGQLYCAARLELSEGEELAQVVLAHTDFEFWPYLAEHNFPRYARRFALHFLAYAEKEKGNYEGALDYLDEAVRIESPIDDLDDMPLLELKVEILLVQDNHEAAFFLIQKIRKKDASNASFSKIVDSESYARFLKMNDLAALEKGGARETTEEALARWSKFLKLNFDDDQEEIKRFDVAFLGRVKQSILAQAEERLDFKFPPSYKEFVLKKGLFKLGRWNDYESCLLAPREMRTLHDELKTQWNPGFMEMNKAQVEETKQLICFSYGDEGLQSVWYYCFDKRSLNPDTGEMSIYSFCQDEWNFDALPICERRGFDVHISQLVDEQIGLFL